ncbi:MAG: serine/threonine protein kinase, partial [Myxococcota bacterium]|nr:serine/threonine protein kinase [Myxococcota bacterium]
MASVWRGVHHTQWTEVAIKIITSRLAHQPRYQSAFRAEIQAAARLHHPGIVLVLDEGQVPAEAE